MLENNPKGVLNKPEIIRREAMIEPVKKKGHWLFKLIIILLILGLVYYLFTNPEVIQNFANNFLSNLLS
jgi:hypothetical protein